MVFLIKYLMSFMKYVCHSKPPSGEDDIRHPCIWYLTNWLSVPLKGIFELVPETHTLELFSCDSSSIVGHVGRSVCPLVHNEFQEVC